MEESSEVAAPVPASLEAILDQMEVSTEPDIHVHTLDVISTTCAEDLLLGGEVEISDAAENPSASQNQETESGGNVIMEGGAGEEGEERPEEAIGMEIEVTRKPSVSSDPVSPAGLPDMSSSGGGQVGEEAAGDATVSGVTVKTGTKKKLVRKRGARRERGRKRNLYIPPVTEWRDCLDSQDVLREFTRNAGQGEGGGGEREVESQGEMGERSNAESQESATSDADKEIDVEGVGEMEQEPTEEDNEVFRQSEMETEEIVDVVEVEKRKEEEKDRRGEEYTEDRDHSTRRIGQPDHLEMFFPSRLPLGHPASFRTSRAADSRKKDLKIAAEFLEQENELLQKARWVPEASRQPVAQPSSKSRPRGDVQATPVISREVVPPTPPPRTCTLSSGTLQSNSSDRVSEAGGVSGVRASRTKSPLPQSDNRSPASGRRASGKKSPLHVPQSGNRSPPSGVRASRKKSPLPQSDNRSPSGRKATGKKSPLHVPQSGNRSPPSGGRASGKKSPLPQSGNRSPPSAVHPPPCVGESHVSDILRGEQSDSQDSFFHHESQMDTGGDEESERPLVTLSTPSGSSEYESAVEVQVADRESNTHPHTPARDTKRGNTRRSVTPQSGASVTKHKIGSRTPNDGNEASGKHREKRVLQHQPVPVPASCTGGPTSTRESRQSGSKLQGYTQIPRHQREAVVSRNARANLSPSKFVASDVEGEENGVSAPVIEGRQGVSMRWAGCKEKMPQPLNCQVKISKYPLISVRRSGGKQKVSPSEAAFMNDICPHLSARPYESKWEKFHTFVDNERPLESRPSTRVSTPPSAVVENHGTEEKREVSDRNDAPFSDEAQSQPLFNSFVMAPPAAVDGWVELDQLWDRDSVSSDGTSETTLRDLPSDSQPNTRLHQQSHHHGSKQVYIHIGCFSHA